LDEQSVDCCYSAKKEEEEGRRDGEHMLVAP
jgi:hypothetical protein